MTIDLTTTIKELEREKSINQELIVNTVETAIKKAYEKYYGTIENLVIRNEDELVLSIFSKKDVVANIQDDLFEISLEKAKEIDNNAEEGDSMLVPCNPENFGRIAIHSAKQIILQRLREIKKDSIYSDFKAKEGEIIIGYVQRLKGETIYVDLGNYEGVLPKKYRSPLETYRQGERIKTIIEEVKKTGKGSISVILSRTSTNFVKKLFEVEIPEIYDKTVQIEKIVREPGYRTKIAVSTNKEEIDPVGACVGQKGSRILNIIKELEDEKIDVIKWSIDIKSFIADALTPAKVENIIRGFNPVEEWLYKNLLDGPVGNIKEYSNFHFFESNENEQEILIEDIYACYRKYNESHRNNRHIDDRRMGAILKKYIPSIQKLRRSIGNRKWYYIIPSLDVCRKEFCEKYKKRIKVKFCCLLRVNLVDEEFARLLKEVGCYRVSMGIESGNEYVRNTIMNRHLSDTQIIRAYGIVHRYGMQSNAINLLGVPGETEEMIWDTIRLNRRIKPSFRVTVKVFLIMSQGKKLVVIITK